MTSYMISTRDMSDCILEPFELTLEQYETIYNYQTLFNEYVFSNSNREFLESVLFKRLRGNDEMCFQLYELIGLDKSKIFCGIFRNDYFLTKDGWKMVEYNTISSSLAALACETHGYSNDAINGIVESLLLSKELFDDYYEVKSSILVVITERDRTKGNRDQEITVSKLKEKGVNIILMSFETLNGIRVLNDFLYVNYDLIGVVYYRSGYELHSERGLEIRRTIERSLAVKCPNVEAQLFGTKLVQSSLTEIQSISETIRQFKRLNVKMIYPPELEIKDETAWLLKCNKEGGGHNVHTNLNEFLRREKERSNWIQVERINPVIRNGSISEIGIYGGIVAFNGKIISNRALGYLVRTKDQNEKEGGVFAGFSRINSLIIK